jgi:hypothetical protein
VSIHGDSDDSSSDDNSTNSSNSNSHSNSNAPNANDSASDSENDSKKDNRAKQNNGHTANASKSLQQQQQQQQQHCGDASSDTSVCYSSSMHSSIATAAAADTVANVIRKSLVVSSNDSMQPDDTTVCTSPLLSRVSAKHTDATSSMTANTNTDNTNNSNTSDTASNNTSAEPLLQTKHSMLKLHQLSSLSSFGSSTSSLPDYSGNDLQDFNETVLLMKLPPKIERYKSTGDQAYNSTTAAATTSTSTSFDANSDNSDDGFADDNCCDNSTAQLLQASQQVRSHSDHLVPSHQQLGSTATVAMPVSLLHSNRSSMRRDHSLRKLYATTDDCTTAATTAANSIDSSVGQNDDNSNTSNTAVRPNSLLLSPKKASMRVSANSTMQSNNRLQHSSEQIHVDGNSSTTKHLHYGKCDDTTTGYNNKVTVTEALTPDRCKRISTATSSHSSNTATSLLQQPIATVPTTTATTTITGNTGTVTAATATAAAAAATGAVEKVFEAASPTARCLSCPLPTARTTPTRTLTPITRKTGDHC